MDMESNVFTNNLVQLVNEKKVPITQVDEAVREVLTKKFELGLFDDPFRFPNKEHEKSEFKKTKHHKTAANMHRKGSVILKNTEPVIPLSTE